jgi:hypothetical protein
MVKRHTYSIIKFNVLINNMSFKCPICNRTLSQHTAYSQHVQNCIKKIELDNNDVEMDTKSNQSSDYENDNIEVILF